MTPKFLKTKIKISIALFFLIISGMSVNGLHAQQLDFTNWMDIIDTSKIIPGVQGYDIISSGNKIGSMVIQKEITNEFIIFRDTSQINDGAVYEEATFFINKNSLKTESASILLINNGVTTNYDYTIEDGKSNGRIIRTNTEDREEVIFDNQIDVSFDVWRSEVFALVESFNLKSGQSVSFKIFSSLQNKVVDGTLQYKGQKVMKVREMNFLVDHFLLEANGLIPTNDLYRSQETRKLLRVDVVESGMQIIIRPEYLFQVRK